MQLAGITGSYGRRLRAAVIGFGATARGAVTALNAHGVDDVRVLTNREVAAVGSPIHSTQIVQMGQDADAPDRTWADTPDGHIPVAHLLADNDIVVNCVLQDPDAPLVFVTEDDLAGFTPGSLIVDVSCDIGMGFSWARPTSFTQPTSNWRTVCTITPWTTARPIYGIRRRGRSATRCCRTSTRFFPGRRHGIQPRRFPALSRFVMAP